MQQEELQMNKTENLKLNVWEKSDPIHAKDFNDNFQTIDQQMPQFVLGSYTGDEQKTRTIPLEFTPKAVFLFESDGTTHYQTGSRANYHAGGLATAENPVKIGDKTVVQIVDHGFQIGFQYSGSAPEYTYVYSNAKNIKYHYIALR